MKNKIEIEVCGFKGKAISEIKEIASLSPRRLFGLDLSKKIKNKKISHEELVLGLRNFGNNIFSMWKTKSQLQSFIITSPKVLGKFKILTFECKERTDIKYPQKLYEGFNDPTEHGLKILYTEHTIDRFFQRSTATHKLNEDYDLHTSAFMSYATRKNVPITHQVINGEDVYMSEVWDLKGSHYDMVECKIGYMPLEIDFSKNIAIAKTLLMPGMRGTPERKFLRKNNPKMAYRLDDTDNLSFSDFDEVKEYLSQFDEFKDSFYRKAKNYKDAYAHGKYVCP